MLSRRRAGKEPMLSTVQVSFGLPGTVSISDEGNANIPLNKKVTRPRKEIFPGYEKFVQDRSKTVCDEEHEEDHDEEQEDEKVVNLK